MTASMFNAFSVEWSEQEWGVVIDALEYYVKHCVDGFDAFVALDIVNDIDERMKYEC